MREAHEAPLPPFRVYGAYRVVRDEESIQSIRGDHGLMLKTVGSSGSGLCGFPPKNAI